MKYMSALLAIGLIANIVWAKDKSKNTLPAYVLQAKTVAIMIDPAVEYSMDGPQANQTAQKDVEAALLKWGRLQPVSDAHAADLIIVVRKGNGRTADPMLPDLRPNNGTMGPGGGGGSIGPQRGPQPGFQPDQGHIPDQPVSHSPSDIGGSEDYFAVFKGGENPRDATPAWRYIGHDGLNPGVPAVAAFKKAVTNAEKAAQKETSAQ